MKCLAGVCCSILLAAASPPFEDRTGDSGINFVLKNGAKGQKRLIETMTGGVAVLDFDNDGLPDIYFVNGEPGDCNRLYRNKGQWRFEDITAQAGVCGRGYGMAASAADYDNDGFVDLAVTTANGLVLFHNRRNGTFEDVTMKAAVQSRGWIVGAAWLDYDNDGFLDLFLVHYVRWEADKEESCGDTHRGVRTYCHPRFYDATANQLYRNNGDGSFTDVSEMSEIGKYRGKGMAAAIADYDGDGHVDIAVTNDTLPNFLFHNDGNGRFHDAAGEAGVGLTDDGKALSSMGIDFRDVDNDLREDIVFTALAHETFPFFRNANGKLFLDRTYPSGIGALTTAFSGWGNGLLDFDNDGWKDLFIATGDVQDNTEQYSSDKSRQPNIVLWNRAGKWSATEVGKPAQHRGVAFADFDRDGRIDVIVTRLNETPLLLRNTTATGHRWLDIKLIGSRSNRQGLGAKVILLAAGGSQLNHATVSVGYASSSDSTIHFGLASTTVIDRIEIRWPAGGRTVLEQVATGNTIEIRESSTTGN